MCIEAILVSTLWIFIKVFTDTVYLRSKNLFVVRGCSVENCWIMSLMWKMLLNIHATFSASLQSSRCETGITYHFLILQDSTQQFWKFRFWIIYLNVIKDFIPGVHYIMCAIVLFSANDFLNIICNKEEHVITNSLCLVRPVLLQLSPFHKFSTLSLQTPGKLLFLSREELVDNKLFLMGKFQNQERCSNLPDLGPWTCHLYCVMCYNNMIALSNK